MAKSSFEGNNRKPAAQGSPAGARRPAAAKPARPQRPEVHRKVEVEDEYDYDRSVKIANRGCLIGVMVLLIVVGAALLWGIMYVTNDVNGKNATATETVQVDVYSGAGATTIGNMLEENGLIKHSMIFRLYVRFNDSGKGFQLGRFYLEPGMSYDEILDVLSEAPPPRETTRVMIPEGSTVYQFATAFERAGLCSAQEFIAMANDVERFSDIGFFKYIEYDPNTYMKAEGYLFPDTYEFFTDETVENMVRTLYERTDYVLNKPFELTGMTVYERMEEQNLSLREVMTLASMVEEEAGLPLNQPGVAGVFWNRLTKDLGGSGLARPTLGSDVTLRYLMDWVSRGYGFSSGADFANYTLEESRNILVEAMPHDVFYGYYTADNDENSRDGLPIGPISSPSRTAIEAALWPEVHNNYFFVTDAYGEYYYARTYNEHLRNVSTASAQTAKKEQEDAASAEAENEEETTGD